MTTIIEALAPKGWVPSKKQFEPLARYFPAMDFLLYVKEDCSFVEDRIDRRLTLLWHPQDDRAIGVRIKGYRAVYEAVLRILKGQDDGFDAEKGFVTLMSSLEVAMLDGDGDFMMAEAEQKRIAEGYRTARGLVAKAKIQAKDVRELMAA